MEVNKDICTTPTKILKAKFDNNAGMIGAALLALKSLCVLMMTCQHAYAVDNAWYSVANARVRFPRTWFSTASAERCIGDSPYATMPRFVNSVRCSFTGVSGSATFFRGALYAADRSDIPAGLPPGDVIGVWNLGLFGHVTDNTKVSFSTVLPTFRYDQTKIRGDRTLKLLRHNGTKWVLVGRATQNEEHLISTAAPVAPLSSGSMNIGFFAVCAQRKGMNISLR